MHNPADSNSQPARAIIVMGVSGCGKTTLARVVAASLRCPFIEGDALHSAANVAKMASGQPLSDADREPWLDQVGKALGDAVARHGRAVAACSALKRAYRDRLRAVIAAPVAFIMLDAPRDELALRVAQRQGHYMQVSLLDSQLAALERPAEDERALLLDARLRPAELCNASLQWLLRG